MSITIASTASGSSLRQPGCRLTLTPGDGLITSGGVLIEELEIKGSSTPNAPDIQGLAVGVTNTIYTALLNRLPA